MADDKNDKMQRRRQQAEDGKKAMLAYEANAVAVRANTEKLRALRLARDAAMPSAPAKASGKSSGKSSTKASSRSAKAGKAAKSKPLSDWLSDQRKDGIHD